MAGDSAGMITPLCGNGMAMAIHSAAILAQHVVAFCETKGYLRQHLESSYTKQWNAHFAKRLWAGRKIQRLFGGDWTSNLAVNLANHVKPVAEYLVRKTHGEVF